MNRNIARRAASFSNIVPTPSQSAQQLYLLWRHGWGRTSNPSNWMPATAEQAHEALYREFCKQWKPTRRFDCGDKFRTQITETWWQYLHHRHDWPGGIQVGGLRIKHLGGTE